MGRAKLLFERVGFDVDPAPIDFEMSCLLDGSIRASGSFPSSEAQVRNPYAFKEIIGGI